MATKKAAAKTTKTVAKKAKTADDYVEENAGHKFENSLKNLNDKKGELSEGQRVELYHLFKAMGFVDETEPEV